MKSTILFTLIILILFIFKKTSKNDLVYVKSSIDKKEYLVANKEDKKEAADLLAQINYNIIKIKIYLNNNKSKYPKYTKYINLLINKSKDMIISENDTNNEYTSYCINKGEQLVLCLRSKKTNQFHKINIIMYVVLHEISHIACPELNHTPLFIDIFKFILTIAVLLNIWKLEDYSMVPIEYCGMTINEKMIEKNDISKLFQTSILN